MANLKQCHQAIQMKSDVLLNVGVSFTHFHIIIEVPLIL
jgi:hypothetical protein